MKRRMQHHLLGFWAFARKSHRHSVLVSACLVIFLAVSVMLIQQVRADSGWTQTDWSGGVGTSTTNQYSSVTNLNATGVAGQATLSGTSGWCSNASCNTSWQYRRSITFDNTTASLGVTSETLTNFPVLVKLSSSNIDYSKTQDSGQDIRFVDPDGTALSYQIEKWDESGTSYVWVKVPSIDINSNTDYVTMYYGNNSASDAQAASSVWDSNYKAVWHLKETSGTTLADSTSNSATSTKLASNTPAPTASGQIGGGQSYNSDSYSTNTKITLASGLTYEAWVKTSSASTTTGITNIANTILSDSSGSIYNLFGIHGGKVRYNQYVSSWTAPLDSSASVNDNNWHHIAVTHNSSTGAVVIYVDGLSNGSGTKTYQTTYNGVSAIGAAYTFENKYNGSLDEIRVSSGVRTPGWMDASYRSEKDLFSTYGSETGQYLASGTLTSAIFDGSSQNDWGQEAFNATVPAGASVSVKVRSGNNADLSDATAFSSCSPISSGSDATSACAPDRTRYVQYQVTLTGDGTSTPTFQDNTISYSASDTVAPTTNASSLLMYKSNGGASVSSNGWNNTNSYFTWTAGADDGSGSGIKGYCLYLGQDNTANPTTTKGLLGTSPVNTNGACQFAVSGTNIDLATSGYLGSALTSSNTPYYLIVKAIDNANNVYSGAAASFQFRYDNTPPSNPSFVTAPSQFVSSKDVALTWPTSGGDAAADSNAGLAGLQYRIGSSGIWYGDTHNSSEDASDLLSNDGSYTTQSSPDFASLVEGNNIVYFRTWDGAGNISTAYVTTVIKLNTSSPSGPQNVIATPSTNTSNSFAFSWLAPVSFTGSAGNLTYCYSINTLPSSGNCTYTVAGVTSLSAGAYATQPGENTFYVVAKDEAGNINYATVASTTFTANTAAPGVPLNLDAADISVKTTSNWKLALSWEEPTQTGAGVASYKVMRSTNGTSFSQVASTSGTSYVDGGLSQQTYYYKVKACDSANNCGALTSAVNKFPTGKFTSPANLLSGPTADEISTKKATISWITDRESDTRVEYGTESGKYQATEASKSDQTVNHSIDLTNLSPGTTYYYRTKWTDEDGNQGVSAEKAFATEPAPSVQDVDVISVNLTSATIRFTSSKATSVKIYYGQNTGFGGTKIINTSLSTSTYDFKLEGLNDGTKYYFKLNTFDADGNEYDNRTVLNFTTPSRPRITNLRFQPVPDQPTSTQQVTWSTNVPSTSELAYGPNGQAQQNAADPRLTTDHSLTIDALNDNTEYSLTAQSRDSAGNLAVSDKQIFHTALDTRPPKISGLKVTSSIKGTGTDAAGQIIVAWKTDEPATSQVAYGEGSDNSNFNTSTAEDRALVTDHAVVVSNLSTSQIFHLKALSKDVAGNLEHSDNRTTIIGNATDSVISIIFNALQKVFGGF